MKVITCASFNGTGSSAITDLISEYSDVQTQSSDFEYRFIHDPDGIMDLEYHLVQNHNRENSGHALKRFFKLSEFNVRKINSKYESQFNNKYLRLTKEYVNDLVDCSYKGWWFFDLYDMGFYKYHLMQAKNHFLRFIGLNGQFMKKNKLLCSHPSEEKFLASTCKYTHALFEAANPEGKKFIEFDQLLPSQNIRKALRYFSDEIFVFVVNRDPRDLFALYGILKEGPASFTSVEDFCNWYKYLMNSGCKEDWKDSEHILHIQFEDLIYKYKETVDKIQRFTGLKETNHIKQFERLNPKRSVNNTQIYKKYCSDKEIRLIEYNLSEYLYDFEAVGKNEIPGINVKENSVF